jgi:RNA polymerase sigma-70 factor (ECF subfamily)
MSVENDARITALFQRYRDPLLAFALRLTSGDWPDAEDVVQETMLRAWREADRLDVGSPSVMPWLATVARRVVIDQHRRKRARPAEARDGVVADLPVDDETTATLLRVAVADAMRELSPAHRQVLRETILRDRTACQAAEVLGVPIGTVKSRLYHAQRALGVVLADRGLLAVPRQAGQRPAAGSGATGSSLDDRRALDLDGDRGQRLGGRAVHDRPVLDAELAAVARALDDAVRDAADSAALVGAHGGERLERVSRGLGDHDLHAREYLTAAHGDVRGGGEGAGTA